jgi:hypothetical protein
MAEPGLDDPVLESLIVTYTEGIEYDRHSAEQRGVVVEAVCAPPNLGSCLRHSLTFQKLYGSTRNTTTLNFPTLKTPRTSHNGFESAVASFEPPKDLSPSATTHNLRRIATSAAPSHFRLRLRTSQSPHIRRIW